MGRQEKSVTVTELKAKCLELVDALDRRKLDAVTITKRGRPVARLVAEGPAPVRGLYGAHPGSARYAEGFDPTLPATEWEGDDGNLAGYPRPGLD